MLRDRRSLAVMFGVPLVLYPVLTIALSTLGANKVKDLKDTRYKVALVNRLAAPELARRMAVSEKDIEVMETGRPLEHLRSGAVEAVVEIPDGFERDLIAGKEVPLPIKLDRSRTESDFVERKLAKIVSGYQEWVIARRLEAYRAPAEVTRGIERKIEDVSTAGQRMGNRLAQILPLLILITGMLGALFPALAATTTERELGTLETLLVTPAARMELLIAKGALVLLCGLVTAALNMLSMSLVLWRTFSLVTGPGETLTIKVSSLALTFLAAVPALVFFTTLVLIIGLLARTFREANSYATPAMLLPIASLALSIADVRPTPGLLVTPIANTTLVMRDILREKGSIGAFSIAMVSSLVYAGLMLSIAARLFSNEQLVNPAWEPLSLKGLGRGRRKGPRLPAVDEAIALFAVSLLLMFYVQPSLMKWGLFAMLATTQVLLVFAPAALFAWLGKWQWRETFKLGAARAEGWGGAVLLGVGLVPVVGLLSAFQNRWWPQNPDAAKVVHDLIVPVLTSHPILTPIFVGLFAGVFEELLFRGPIQTALMRRCTPWFAIVVTAIIFAAAHLDLHGLALRAVLGVVLGWVVWRTGSIYPGMIVHGLYDAGVLGFAAWHVVHKTEPPLFDGWTALRATIGIGMIVVAVWLIQRCRKSGAGHPAEGFPVLPVQ